MTDASLFNMPMYWEQRKVIQVRQKPSNLDRSKLSADNIGNSLSSPRDSISSKSTKSSWSSRGSMINKTPVEQSFFLPHTYAAREFLTVDLSPMDSSELNMVVLNYGYRVNIDPLSYPGGFETITWDTEKIEETVTQQFLREKISSKPSKERLDVPMGFGDGLTDTTYAEWVVQKAKRFFLLLLEFGVPEKIFDVVDQSWDDDDLPIDRDHIPRLMLRDVQDKTMEAKFYKRQFAYILRDMPKRGHVIYEDDDYVPLEVLSRQKSNGNSFPGDEKVYRPKNAREIMFRRRVPLGDVSNGIRKIDFEAEVDLLRRASHDHIVDLELSYVHQGEGFIMTSPCCDTSLKTFLQNPTGAFKSLSKEQKRRRLLVWIHCLSDAVAFLHEQNIYTLDIRPRTIMVHGDNIYLSDLAIMTKLDPSNKKAENIEAERYEYDAPEHWKQIQSTTITAPTTPVSTRTPFKAWSMMLSSTAPTMVNDDESSVDSESSAISTKIVARAVSTPNFSSVKVGEWVSNISRPAKASTFSLACVFLDLLSFNAKKKSSAFTVHRTNKKGSSRSGGKPDTSFHSNLNQVYSWMDILAEKNKGKEDRAVKSILELCQSMLCKQPELRPAQRDVADKLWSILRIEGGMPHCGCESLNYSPSKEELEDMAIIGKAVDEWNWPWHDDKRVTRHSPVMIAVNDMDGKF